MLYLLMKLLLFVPARNFDDLTLIRTDYEYRSAKKINEKINYVHKYVIAFI